ncbi:hypothetical protein [Streptomyces sp. NPDC060031]|uniref:hypothetical protein n=1 Tax=Streptomyces sp. NPDC060031 TaxID=3347043 RepID=UPI0036CC5B24
MIRGGIRALAPRGAAEPKRRLARPTSLGTDGVLPGRTGVAAAFVVHAAPVSAAANVLTLLPHRLVRAVVAIGILGGRTLVKYVPLKLIGKIGAARWPVARYAKAPRPHRGRGAFAHPWCERGPVGVRPCGA